MDTILVLAIVTVAALYVGRMLYRRFTAKDIGCGCGCSGGCGGGCNGSSCGTDCDGCR